VHDDAGIDGADDRGAFRTDPPAAGCDAGATRSDAELAPVPKHAASPRGRRVGEPRGPVRSRRTSPLPAGPSADPTATYGVDRADGQRWATQCAWCGRMKSRRGEWVVVAADDRSCIRAALTHGICPECAVDVDMGSCPSPGGGGGPDDR
jgi:hypothetical protein